MLMLKNTITESKNLQKEFKIKFNQAEERISKLNMGHLKLLGVRCKNKKE